MNRITYITNDILSLSEYIADLDDIDQYNCWLEPETQAGYNHKFTGTFEEFKKGEIRSRFIATVTRCADKACMGSVFVSPENCLPDLAIMMYKPYRNQGFGTMAFSLGVKYCFETLKLDKIFAGCYADNIESMKMLKKCSFQPHPDGNQNEKHYLTDENIIQYDFVIYKNIMLG